MGQAFIIIHDFFSRHLWAFLVFFALLIAFIGWYGSKITLEEDINKVIPSSAKNEKLINVLQHSKFADRLVFCVTLKDSENQADHKLLISFTESLIDSLNSPETTKYIDKIEGRFSPSSFSGMYDLFYENLPLFLEQSDYAEIESRLGDSAIATAIKRDYEALITAGGFAMRDFILKDPLSLTPIALKKLEGLKVSGNFELLGDYIISRDRRNLLFFITPSHPVTETSLNAELLALIESYDGSLKEHYSDKIKTYYFGSMAVSISNASQIKRDIIITVSIASLVLVVFLGLYFRRKFSFILLFLPAILGGSFAIAILSIIKDEVSAISLGLGSVMLGISIDYALHFLSHLRHSGTVKTVIKDIAGPVMISSITTASAFLCLMVLKSEALRDLGLFAAISVLSSAFFTLTILPQFFRKENKLTGPVKNSFLLSGMGKIASYAYDQNKKLGWAITIIFLLFIFTSTRVEFESNMDSMNYMSQELIESEDFLDSISSYKLRSVFLVSIAPDLNRALIINESLVSSIDDLMEDGIIQAYSSVHPFYPSNEYRSEKIRRWKAFWTEERAVSVKQSIIRSSAEYRFKENTFDQFYSLIKYNRKPETEALLLLKETFLDEYISETDSLTMLTTILKVKAEDKAKIYAAFDLREDVIVFDRQSLTSSFMDGLRDDFDTLILISLLVVFLILTLSLGRIELGIITFIPLLISWIWTLGIMGLLGIKFNIFNIVISTFIFGLGIDYAIFTLRGLQQEYQYGRKKLSSYKTSILLSGITTIVGIGVLIFARHPALQSIALSAIIGILSVILITYTLLPRLFRFLVEHEGRSRKWPATLMDFIFSINTLMIFLVGVIILDISGLLLRYFIPVSMKRKKLIFHKMLSLATWTIVYGSVNIRKKIWNHSGEDFKKPAIIVCNHQSHLDTVLTIMQNPRMILLTNAWVQKSIFYRGFIRFADFFSVEEGANKLKEKIRTIVNSGYSVLYFPEGTRSPDLEIGRFHQGAFYMARELNLDILPIISYGSGNVMPKFEPFLKTTPATMTILPRIHPDDPLIKETSLATARSVRHHMMEEYALIRKKIETPDFIRKKVVRNYLYRSPMLEWYMKVKIRLDDNYQVFDEYLPGQGLITDIGCGYGFMAYMLQLLSPQRKFHALDHDPDKIDTANNCALKNENIEFEQADVSEVSFKSGDAFLLIDVLHYLPEDEQQKLISRCAQTLNDKGVIIIRDADPGMKKKHRGTRISEFFSTGIGFNKTWKDEKKLFFLSKEKYLQIFSQNNLSVTTIDETKMNSNLIYILKKK